MNTVNDYFKKHTDKISFIELKDNKMLNIEGYTIDEDTPLPILTDDLVKEITEGNLEEEINMSNIIDGIIFTMGIDENFKHMEDYKNILKSYSGEIEEYIFYKGIKFIEDEKYDMGAIQFRALKILNPENINGKFNYALALESIGKSFFAAEDDENGLKFIDGSTLELESILELDDSYPLSYYKLGYHYKFYEQYLKAKLIWNKYLRLDRDEIRLQEIRIELENIEDDVNFEAGLTYLTKPDFENALDQFLKLLPKHEKWWELNYYLGLCYKGLGEYEKALEYFKLALEENEEVAEVYNELAITYISIDMIEDAVEILSEGIDKVEDDYRLFFNRGIAYLQLNNLEKGYEDIKIASELNPEDENIAAQKERLEELL